LESALVFGLCFAAGVFALVVCELLAGMLVDGVLIAAAVGEGRCVEATLSGAVERWAARGEQVMNRDVEMRRKL
jgi:hypothetical protein